MFDFIIDIPESYNWGTIESIKDGTLTLTKESFAPGVWAGIKPDKFTIVRGDKTITTIFITGIDLNTRVVTYSQSLKFPFQQGDEIYFYPRIK